MDVVKKWDSEIIPYLSVLVVVIKKKNSSLAGSRTEGGELGYG